MKHYAFAALVMSTPFTWSYLAKVSGFLVRPFDVLGIALALILFFSGRVRINTYAAKCVFLFLLLIGWMSLSVLFSEYDHGSVGIFKISYYLIISIALLNYIVETDFTLSSFHYAIIIASFLGYLIISQNEAIDAFRVLIEQSVTAPDRAIFFFWNKIFNINLFSSANLIDVKGVSFRNTSALGFLTLALISYGFIKNKIFNNILTPLFIFMVLFLQSRVAIVCASIFVIMIILSSRETRTVLNAFLIAACVSVAFISDFIFNSTLARFNSGIGSRASLFEGGLQKMVEAPLFGQGNDAVVAHLSGDDKTVHNVAVALGAEYGVAAFLFAVGIMLLSFFSIIVFSKKWLSSRDRAARKLYAVFTVAACIVFIRPNFSASVDNFYSLAEWVCFSIVAAGHTFMRQPMRRYS